MLVAYRAGTPLPVGSLPVATIRTSSLEREESKYVYGTSSTRIITALNRMKDCDVCRSLCKTPIDGRQSRLRWPIAQEVLAECVNCNFFFGTTKNMLPASLESR
jgi:hypothetical protein